MTGGRAVLPKIKAVQEFAFYSSPTRVWEFGVGVLLALARRRLERIPPAGVVAAGVVGLAVVLGSAVAFDGGTAFPGAAAVAPVVGTALLIVGGVAGSLGVARLMSTRPMVWVGDRSYSWYLWHWPMVVFARAAWPHVPWVPVAASCASLLPTWASYRFLENPIRFAQGPARRSTVALAAVCMALPIGAGATLLLARRAIAATPHGEALQAANRLHADALRNCDGAAPGALGRCVWPVADPRGRILLVGDSNAGQFTEPVVRAGNEAGYEVSVTTLHGCPFGDVELVRRGVPDARCHAFVAATLDAIEARPPSLVVLASASDGYIEESSAAIRSGGRLASGAEEKARLWRDGVRAVVSRIATVAPVVVVHPVPRFHGWTLSACATWMALAHPAACAAETTRSSTEGWRRRAVDSEREAAAATDGATTLDLVDALCQGETCSALADGRWMFRDGGHLTVDGALTLTDRFAAVIAARARR